MVFKFEFMKYLYRSVLSLLFYFLLIGFTDSAKAQDNTHNWQLGLGIGYTNYYGDLSNYRIHGGNELYKIYRFANYNSHYQHQPSFSLLLQKKITPTLGIMFQANYLQFSMSDRYIKNNGSLDSSSGSFSRSLNFQNTMQDVGLAFTFSPNNGKIGSEKAFFYPSFYLGVGVSKFVVKGDLYDANNNPYNYRLPGNINDGNYETNLRDLRSESDSKFQDVEPYVDLGLALNFRISQLLSIAIHSDIKYSASDQLDNVSGIYKPSYPTAAEAYAARPGYNAVNPVTMQRGDNNGVNDIYINNRIVLNIALSGKRSVKTFSAPVIYSLNTPYFYQKKITDSVKKKIINADSIMRLRTDSVNKALKDSLSRMSSMNKLPASSDSVVTKQLENINTELKGIKEILREQQFKPRLQQLQYQIDSIKNLKSKVENLRTPTKEGSLLLRVYDLQIDSLRNEYEKVQLRQNQPLNKADSAVLFYNRNIVPKESATTNSMTDEVVIAGYNDSVRLQNSYSRKIDSIQKRLNELESASSNQPSIATENVNRVNSSDSLNAVKDKADSDDRLKRQDQSLVALQQQLKASNDSAVYYKNLHESQITTSDTLQQKVPWYERYFGIGRKKKKIVSVDTTSIIDNTIKSQETIKQPVMADTLQKKAPWYQRYFGIGRKKNKISAADDTTTLKNNSQTQTTVMQEPAPDTLQKKPNWFQRTFGAGRKKKFSVKKDTVQSNDNLRQQQFYESEAELTNRKINQVQKSESDQAIERINYSREHNLNIDSAEYVRNVSIVQKRMQLNSDSIKLLNRQLQRSNDSIKYYKNLMSDVNTDAPAESKKWYQDMFTSEKKKQRRMEEQSNTRERTIQQQQYFDNDVRNMQARIGELERANSDLQNSYQSYNPGRNVRRDNTLPVSPVVVYDGNNNNGNNNREIADLRAQLQNLQNELNYDGRERVKRDNLDALPQQPLTVLQSPAAIASDTSQVSLLRSELNQLRTQLDSIKNKPLAVATEKVIVPQQKFDVTGFPVISVYFKMGSVSLTSDQLNKIIPFGAVANKNKEAAIILKGFTDPVGNPAKNKVIADKRAVYIKSLLTSKYRISDSRVNIEEPGESETNSKKANPLDRRVDLQFN